MSRLIALLITLSLMSLAFFLAIQHFADISDKEQAAKDAQWLTFSMQHKCRLISPSTFFRLQDTWQCDGFQVSR